MIPLPTLAMLFLGVQTADPVRIEATWDGTSCGVCVDGAQVTQEELDRRARKWAAEKRAVAIVNSQDTPYRCIGGTIFNLQAAGLTRIGFFSEPPPAEADKPQP